MNNIRGFKIIISVIVLSIIAVLITYTVSKANKNKQLKIINEEIASLSNLNLETYEINMKIKTKGSFAIVEETIKVYLKNIQKEYKEIIEICNNNQIEQLLTIENIQADGPEFMKTREILQQFKENFYTRINNYNKLMSEHNIKQEIEDKNISHYYKKLYISLMLDSETGKKLTKILEQMNNSSNQINTMVEHLEKMLDFLTENKEYWSVNEGILQFNNDTVLSKYDELRTNLLGE